MVIRPYKQNTPKTKSGDRIVPLNKEAFMAVRTINGNFRYVFATSKGKRVHPRNVDRMFRSVLKNCDIKGVGVHALRHTFAIRLFASGVDVKVVSQLLGHSEVGITIPVPNSNMKPVAVPTDIYTENNKQCVLAILVRTLFSSVKTEKKVDLMID